MSECVNLEMSEGVDVKMSGVDLDRALAGVRDARIGGGSNSDVDMSALESVAHRYALDGTMKQVSFVSADVIFQNLVCMFSRLQAADHRELSRRDILGFEKLRQCSFT